jgi:hypothetical protein
MKKYFFCQKIIIIWLRCKKIVMKKYKFSSEQENLSKKNNFFVKMQRFNHQIQRFCQKVEI